MNQLGLKKRPEDKKAKGRDDTCPINFLILQSKDDRNKNKEEEEKIEHGNDTDRDNENDEGESSIRFPLKEGRVIGLPKDPASVPAEIRLSKKIHKQGNEAMEQTKQSGREWGFFLHFDEVGRLIPGKVKGPSEKASEDEWITREEYLQIKKQDETIHGNFHTHPKSTRYPGAELMLSHGNIGFFLEAEDVFNICKVPQSDYLLILRTKQTDPSREGSGEEAATAYLDLAWNKQTANLIAGMELKPAIDKAVNEAMIEICKKYNIALYKELGDKAVKKLE